MYQKHHMSPITAASVDIQQVESIKITQSHKYSWFWGCLAHRYLIEQLFDQSNSNRRKHINRKYISAEVNTFTFN